MEKFFIYIFSVLGAACTLGISLGAYWHLYTAAGCWLLVHVLKQELKTNKNNKQ